MVYNLIATMAAGLEAITAKELRDLGYETIVENGRVRFHGDQSDIAKTNVWLRTADRIKIIVGEFDALTFDDLFEQTKAIAWDEWLPMDAEFPVTGRCVRSTLHSEPDVQSITKKAIVDKLSTIYHRHSRLPETGKKYPLDVNITKDHVLLTLDTTGSSLFKRGYRVEAGEAPLKENFAAALILLTNWKIDMPLLDPTTGSGTIPIEAALIGHNIAPGLNRSFVFNEFDWFQDQILEDVKDEAISKADFDRKLEIYGNDIDQKMIDIARLNAQQAGLLHSVVFKQVAVQDFHTDLTNGVMISNPPYGQRMSDQETVRKLYHQMGQVFIPMKTWSAYILTSDLQFQESYGKRATKRRKLYNGSIRTDFFQYWGKPVWHH